MTIGGVLPVLFGFAGEVVKLFGDSGLKLFRELG